MAVRIYGDEVSEREVQTRVVRALRKLGITVLESSNARRTSNTKGFPDAMVHVTASLWCAVEFKRSEKGRVRAAQQKFSDEGKIVVFADTKECLDYLLSVRAGLFGRGPLPRLKR